MAALGLLILTAFVPTARAQYCRPENAQKRHDIDRLPLVAQAGISRAVGQDQLAYLPTVEASGFRMTNGALSIDLQSGGVRFAVSGTTWGMKLAGYGYGDTPRATADVKPNSAANRVEYRRGGLTEWYVNGPRGFEQGFTLARAPGKSQGQPLILLFALSGSAAPSIESGGKDLTLAEGGAAKLRYGSLEAIDARGRELRAWLELRHGQLAINVDDARAQYPILVDPFVEAAKLVACDTTPSDIFGYSVAVSQDGKTVVVGAPGSTSAYVFQKPGGLFGWAGARAVAKLEPGQETQRYAYGVGISNDGNTVIVSDELGGSEINGYIFGGVYIYVKPSTGWAQSSALTPTAVLTAGAYSAAISGDGNAIVAGNNAFAGSANVFVKPSTGWASTSAYNAELALSFPIDTTGPESTYELGFSVAITNDGTTIVAGAIGWSGKQVDQGAAFVFLEPSGGWADETANALLFASDGEYLDRLGAWVSISSDGNTIVLGALGGSTPTGAYVFSKPATGWTVSTETAKLTDSTGLYVLSPVISNDGNTIVTTPDAFVKPADGWVSSTETSRLVPAPEIASEFQPSLAISGDGETVVAGHFYQFTDAPSTDPNAAYIYTGSGAPCQCATDVTGSVSVVRSGYVYNFSTGRYAQNVTVTNTSASTITGPITLVLDNLSSNASLFNATGATDLLQYPAGSPYITMNGNLASGQMVTFGLQFTNPTRAAITYTTRVLAGPGTL